MYSKNYKLTFLMFISLMLSLTAISAQTNTVTIKDSITNEPSNWKLGMGFGLNFVGGTNINLAPSLLYNVSEKITFGVGLQYNYSAIKDLKKTSTIGGTLSTFYSPTPRFLTLLEFAELNVTSKTETPEGEIKDDFWESALFIGAGLNITNSITVGAKYNVLYKEDESVYTSSVIPFVNIAF
ncbi:MAG: hypothetical protein KJN66_07435 [Bacteroidia bacterium]|nr:hypothetical protein [Bacteroidia bacterium]